MLSFIDIFSKKAVCFLVNFFIYSCHRGQQNFSCQFSRVIPRFLGYKASSRFMNKVYVLERPVQYWNSRQCMLLINICILDKFEITVFNRNRSCYNDIYKKFFFQIKRYVNVLSFILALRARVKNMDFLAPSRSPRMHHDLVFHMLYVEWTCGLYSNFRAAPFLVHIVHISFPFRA
jgi:hypothetical protein